MKFSAQHYNTVAGILSNELATIRRTAPKPRSQYDLGMENALHKFAILFADECEQDNPRFNRERFYKAVGI